MAVRGTAAGLPTNSEWQFVSPSIDLQLSPTAPGLVSLNIDGLAMGKRGANVLRTPAPAAPEYAVAHSAGSGFHRAEYRMPGQPADSAAQWTITVTGRTIQLTSQWNAAKPPEPLTLSFDLDRCHSTLLGVFDTEGNIRLPAVLHMPGQGSARIAATGMREPRAGYTASRAAGLNVVFPPATVTGQRVEYRLEIAAIYPELPGIEGDHRFDSYKRNWLNVLQLNPSRRLLSNSTTSDSCAFCYYEYADIAANSPLLAEGLSALDIVRQTLDGILGGAHAYGLPGPGTFPVESSDSLPSMLIAAHACVRGGLRDTWLTANYKGIKRWADKMLATDKDGNGLVEYVVSGNSGIWPDGIPKVRPSNWWDTIGFGHEDAYANALAYRALGCMEEMARRVGGHDDVIRFHAAAEKLRDRYFRTFYNPTTGVMAGWKSADGNLHDYYFLWVSGIAILYGLVPKDQANAIMDKLLTKMKAAGYTRFDMGLPGNLITIALKDYVHKDPDGHHGGGVREDNADGFQKYENGGATACFAYFTLAALYRLGRRDDGDRILFPMLDGFGRGGFEGRGANGKSNDWRMWDGTPLGYEGFLVDNYYTLLAVLAREQSNLRAAPARASLPEYGGRGANSQYR
jgi:hypothetical protein